MYTCRRKGHQIRGRLCILEYIRFTYRDVAIMLKSLPIMLFHNAPENVQLCC